MISKKNKEKVDLCAAVKYAKGVVDGSIVAARYLRLQAKRFLLDVYEREDIIFSYSEYEDVVLFFPLLHHYKGVDPRADNTFYLEPWQCFLLANLICLYYKETRKRKYQVGLVLVSRKSGKSFFTAALALYLSMLEQGAEVCVSAGSRAQAAILFEMATELAKQLDPSQSTIKCLRNEIKIKDLKSHILCLHSESSRLDGLDSSFSILDEACNNPKAAEMFEILRSSQISRPNPLILGISTPGLSKKDNFGYELRCKIAANLEKKLGDEGYDDRLFGMLAEAEEGDYEKLFGDDVEERIKVYKKSNLNYGVTSTFEILEQRRLEAMNGTPSQRAAILVKNFALWQNEDKGVKWLSARQIKECSQKIDLSDYKGRTASVALDLGTVSDLTSATFIIYPEDLEDEREYPILKTFFFLPVDALEKSPISDFLQRMANEGYLYLTEGSVTDYHYIEHLIVQTAEYITIDRIVYDKYNSTQLVLNLQNSISCELCPFSQTLSSFNLPTKYTEVLVLKREVIFDENPLTEYCFDNCVLKIDSNNNVKPVKPNYGRTQTEDRSKKIDGAQTCVMAIAALCIYKAENGYGLAETFSLSD